MNDIDNAKLRIANAMRELKHGEQDLERAQEPKISLEHLGVYELENGEVKFAIKGTAVGTFFIESFGPSDSHGRYDKDGTPHYAGDSYYPVVKHVGKIGIVPVSYDFGIAFPGWVSDPLTFNTK